jgi:hypothetical protein
VPLYPAGFEKAGTPNPSGVALTDDSILAFEHFGGEIVWVDLDAIEEELGGRALLGRVGELGACSYLALIKGGPHAIGWTHADSEAAPFTDDDVAAHKLQCECPGRPTSGRRRRSARGHILSFL